MMLEEYAEAELGTRDLEEADRRARVIRHWRATVEEVDLDA